MDQGSDVDQLHVCREREVSARVGSVGFGGEQGQSRPQAFAARSQHAADGFGDQRIVGCERRAEEFLDQHRQVAIGGVVRVDHFVPTWIAIAPPPMRM